MDNTSVYNESEVNFDLFGSFLQMALSSRQEFQKMTHCMPIPLKSVGTGCTGD